MEQQDVQTSPDVEKGASKKEQSKGTSSDTAPGANDRDEFGNNFEFVLTCLGLAVGLGNIWRFPTRAYENGGSAFLIPYVTCAVLFGLPAIYLEFLAGQYQGVSPPIVFRRIMPALEGVGWMGSLVAAYVAIYYIVIISWISIYIVNIFRGHINVWNKCDNPWNVKETCMNMLEQKLCDVEKPPGFPAGLPKPDKFLYINGTCTDVKKFEGIALMSATEQYFQYNVIAPSTGLYDISGFNLGIFASMTVCWIITAILILKGMKIMGKISYVTVILPYILVVVLAIRGMTLEGASTGLYYYFGKPDISKIWALKTWSEALKQLCFSLSVGHGGLISMASYSKRRHNCFKDAMVIIIGDTLMSLIGGSAVFSILGFLAVQRGVTVPEVVQSGLSLAFVVYPEAMTQMPLPWLWTMLFFVMLFLLAISSEIALVEVFCSCIYDQHKSVRSKKWLVVSIWCFFLYSVGLIFSTNAGLYWFELYDEYGAGFSSVCAVTIEVIVIVWIYGGTNFRQDIIEMIGEAKNPITAAIGPLSPYFFWNWKIIAPIFGIVLIGFSFMRDYPYMGDAAKYPILFDIFGWFLSISPVLAVPVFAVKNYLWIKNNGYDISGFTMLQKQHASHARISADYDEGKKELDKLLPDKEPWDVDDKLIQATPEPIQPAPDAEVNANQQNASGNNQ